MEVLVSVKDLLSQSLNIGSGVVRAFLNLEVDNVVERFTNYSESHSTHQIFGECTSFVGADGRGAAEGLDGGKSSNNAVVLGHLAGSESKTRGNDSGETFWNSSDSKSNSNLEVVDAALDPATEDGIIELKEVHGPHQSADDEDDLGELIGELVELLLQWSVSLILFSLVDFGVDAANRGVHTSVSNHADSVSAVNHSGAEEHVLLVLKHLGISSHRFDGLLYRDRFTSERGLASHERNALDFDDSQVGGAKVTSGNLNNVAGDKLDSLELLPLRVAQNLALLGLEVHECFQSVVCIGVLVNGDDSIEDQNCQNYEGFDEGSKAAIFLQACEHESDASRTQEDLNELILELFHDPLPKGGLGLLFQFIETVLLLKLLNLLVSETLLEASTELL